MYVKDIILKSCDFIGDEELYEEIVSQSLTEENQKNVERLVKYFNLIRDEIAREYQPQLEVEKFVVKKFKLEFSSFAKQPIEIYSIKDRFGRNVNYKIFDGYIFVCGKEVEVIYSTTPEELTFEGEFNSSLPERLFAYGIAREYFFLNGQYDDANIWEGRFKGALQILLRRKSEVKTPRRRWI